MSVNSWRVLRDNIGIVRYGFFLSRIFQRRKHERMCSRFFLSEGSMISNPQPVFFPFGKDMSVNS